MKEIICTAVEANISRLSCSNERTVLTRPWYFGFEIWLAIATDDSAFTSEFVQVSGKVLAGPDNTPWMQTRKPTPTRCSLQSKYTIAALWWIKGW